MARLPPSRRTNKYRSAPLVTSCNQAEKTASHPVDSESNDRSSAKASSDIYRNVGRNKEHESGNDEEGVPSEMTIQLQEANATSGVMPESLNQSSTYDSTHARPPVIRAGALATDDIAQSDKRNSAKLAKGTIAIENGKVYDLSLWKAISNTLWSRWLILSMLQLSGCKSFRKY